MTSEGGLATESDGRGGQVRKVSAGQSRVCRQRAVRLSHHSTFWHSQSTLLPDGASVPLPLGLHCGKGGCAGQGAVASVPLGHVGVRTMYCLDVFPERAGVGVAFGAARELAHIGLLLSGKGRQQARV